MNNYSTNYLKQITIKSGKKSIFYNLNEICSIIEKNNQVICNLVSQKEIPLQHDFDTLKQLLLNHNFVLIGQNIIINRNEIKMIRDCEGGAKIYTKCNSIIHVNENYSKLKRELQFV
jgi:DNA-binding LytR/AlgR family response regulator